MTDELPNSDFEPTYTPRRGLREQYARYFLTRAGVDDETAETFLNARQDELYGESPLSLIYTGRFEQGIAAAEEFAETVTKHEE